MKSIPLSEISEDFQTIQLQNGKIATLYQAVLARVKEVDPNKDIIVYKYKVPCPLCDYKEENISFSYDGKYFNNTQVNCRHCGIFFRPVMRRN